MNNPGLIGRSLYQHQGPNAPSIVNRSLLPADSLTKHHNIIYN